MNFAMLLAGLLSLGADPAPVQADVVLVNGTLIDGTGKPGVQGNLALRGDRIVAVGNFQYDPKAKILDCTGLVIAPGFIDLHTHSDNPLQERETAPNLNYLTQGVTTAVTGNCGFGPVDVAGYFAKLEKQGVGTNVIHQVPHNNLRQQVMGNTNRSPTDKELKKMEALVHKGMKDGAFGFATGLIYNPGTYSQTDELIALARVAGQHGGFYASHIRNESVDVLAALEEILTIARKAGLRVHISHIKVSGRPAWGKGPDMLALIQRARMEGLEVTADQYPYIASSTSITATLVPPRYREGTHQELVQRLDDPQVGPKLIQDIEARLDKNAPNLRIAKYAPKTAWQGKDLAAIAKLEKKTPIEIVLEILRKGGASIVNFNMNEEEVRLFMKQPFVATASDGSAQIPGRSVIHPRSYGTFPRKIGLYAIQEKIIPLEQAIRSASGLPADILRVPQRGYLKEGYFADVVVFDPATFRDKADFDRPHQYAVGVRQLFVNGQPVIQESRFTGTLAGRVLRWESGLKKGE